MLSTRAARAAAVLLFVAFPAFAGTPDPCPPDPNFTFPDFSDVSAFQLNGDAAQAGNVLRVAPDANNQRGTAFVSTPFLINAATSFSTDFRFRMAGSTSDGADGLSFILQPFGPGAIGTPGEGMGYESLNPSLAIELDTYQNGFDPNANHVGVQINGSTTSVATANPGFDMEDGAVHRAWIDYDGTANTLRIYIADNPATKPTVPTLVVTGIDLVGQVGSSLYMGFGAATGALRNNHDILTWNHSVCQGCLLDSECDDGLFCNGAETCAGNVCLPGTDPCGGLPCDETNDTCTASPRIENGLVAVGSTPVTVNLVNTYFDPVVVTTVQYLNNTIPVVSRVTGVGPTSFQLYLQNPSLGPVAPETVHYLVVERGSWTLDGTRIEAQKYTSTITDGQTGWSGQVQSYLQGYTRPVVVGQVMTDNDPDWSVFWCRGRLQAQAPDAGNLATGKTVCQDFDTTRADETVGFVVFEESHGFIGGVEFEAALGPVAIGGVDDAPPYEYRFGTAFAASPQIAVASMNGVRILDGGWAQLHGSPPASTDRLFLSIEEDQITDAERSHPPEQVAFAAFESAFAYEPAPCNVDADCDDGLFCNGVETCLVGYCQASVGKCGGLVCNEFDDICEFSPLARMEAVQQVVGASAVTVPLTNYYISPVVVCSAQYDLNSVPIVTRVSNVSSTSFDVRLQNPSGGVPVGENVSCLIVEEGSWVIDGVRIDAQRFNSTVTDENNSWVGQPLSYLQLFSSPVVLGQVMTEADPDWSVFWSRGTSRQQPPSPTALNVGKTVCEDSDTTRADETLGVIVFETGHGTVAGVEYEAALGADSVRGTGNNPPYPYTFATPFAVTPLLALVSQSGMDGANGSWAQIHGGTLATTTQLFLSVDEDQIANPERNHATEQVAYVVFEDSFVYQPPSGCSTDYDCDDGDFCNGLEVCVSGVCDVIPVDCGGDVFGP